MSSIAQLMPFRFAYAAAPARAVNVLCSPRSVSSHTSDPFFDAPLPNPGPRRLLPIVRRSSPSAPYGFVPRYLIRGQEENGYYFAAFAKGRIAKAGMSHARISKFIFIITQTPHTRNKNRSPVNVPSFIPYRHSHFIQASSEKGCRAQS